MGGSKKESGRGRLGLDDRLRTTDGGPSGIVPFPMNTDSGALPPLVVERLRAYQQQIVGLQAAQQAFMAGVFASLGITGPVKVNFADMTYEVQDGQLDSSD